MSIPPRIRVWLHADSLESGGLEKNVETIATGLPKDTFEPYVSWSWRDGVVGDRIRAAGIPVFHLPHAPEFRSSSVGVLRRASPTVFHSFSCAKHAHDTDLAADAGIPCVVTFRGNIRHWDPKLEVQPWEQKRNARTHRITACCQTVADYCARIEGVERDRITTVLNGAPEPPPRGTTADLRAELGLTPLSFVVGYLARYRKLKAHDVLIRAFAQVLAVRPDSHLVCSGLADDGVLEELRSLVAELGVANRIHLLDSRDDVSALYYGFDLYAHASRSEGFSNSILEAMAHGLPVVATRVGGTAEALEDGVTGALVEPGDAEALASAIIRAAGNPDLRIAWGQAGRSAVSQRFTMASMIAGYADVYRSLATRPGEAPTTGLRSLFGRLLRGFGG